MLVFCLCVCLVLLCYKNEKTVAGKQQHLVHKATGALSTFVVTVNVLESFYRQHGLSG